MFDRHRLTCTLLTLLVAVLAHGCSASSPRRNIPPSSPPPGRWAPPAPGYYRSNPPPPVTTYQPPPPWTPFRMPPPPPSPGVVRPVHLGALLAALPQAPCAPAEVSPGNWVGFDCSLPTLISRAVPFIRPSQLVTGILPAAVDHRADGMEGPIKSQGAVGTCTAVSLSSAMEHALRRMAVTETVSAIHVWSQYRVPKMGKAGDATVDKRIAPEVAWPYDPATACKMMRRSTDACGAAYGVVPNSGDFDPEVQTQQKKASAAGRYRVIGIEKVDHHDTEVLASILAGGDDLWVAFNLNRNAWRRSGMVDHVIQDYVPNQSTGHAVVIAGYRTVAGGRQFLLHNSWGAGWGDNGYAWISDNMVRTQLRYAYRVRLENPAGGTTPGGTTPGGTTPGGATPATSACPAGQTMDLIYQQCVPACASGAPPAAGLCAPLLPGLLPPATQPTPHGNSCPQGQAPDVMLGQCAALCAGGLPQIGGMCLPQIQ